MARATRASTKAKTEASKDKLKTVVAKKETAAKKKVEKKVTVKKITEKKTIEKKATSESTRKVEEKAAAETAKEDEEGVPVLVSIEACKSWNAFKSRAAKIQKGVGGKAKVEINKEKPGKGNFIVTISGVDTPIVDLKAMKRPFPALKNLDMDEVVKKVLEAI